MIEEIFDKVEYDAKGFRPKFGWSDDVNEVADRINRPHEDYPLRVDKTKTCIDTHRRHWCIRELDIREMHSLLFGGDGFNEKHILRGDYRKVGVSVGRHIAPEPLQIPYLMSRIMPASIPLETEEDVFVVQNDEDLIWWYMLFETIHPFQDGNGRIGGIVVAILSYSLYKKYLMPLT